MKVVAGIAGVTLAVSIAALIIGVASVARTCQATAGDRFAFVGGIACASVGAVIGLGTIAQAIRRRRARPAFWWYLGTAAVCAATIVIGTFASASGFTLCLT